PDILSWTPPVTAYRRRGRTDHPTVGYRFRSRSLAILISYLRKSAGFPKPAAREERQRSLCLKRNLRGLAPIWITLLLIGQTRALDRTDVSEIIGVGRKQSCRFSLDPLCAKAVSGSGCGHFQMDHSNRTGLKGGTARRPRVLRDERR